MSNFRLEVLEQSGKRIFRMAGELDLGSVAVLREALATVESDRPPLVVLDLRELTFIDSTGLSAILSVYTRSRTAGFELGIVRGPDAVHKVFQITRTAERLWIVDDPAWLRS